MNSKKAQSEIITTVLIILLVLAAIIIVWQVVQTTIGKTKTGIDDNSLCLGSQLTIVKAVANSSLTSLGNITVSRDPSSSTNDANVTARIFVDGAQIPQTMGQLAVYSRNTTSVSLSVGQQVKVAAILSQDGYICPATSTVSVVAA